MIPVFFQYKIKIQECYIFGVYFQNYFFNSAQNFKNGSKAYFFNFFQEPEKGCCESLRTNFVSFFKRKDFNKREKICVSVDS